MRSLNTLIFGIIIMVGYAIWASRQIGGDWPFNWWSAKGFLYSLPLVIIGGWLNYQVQRAEKLDEDDKREGKMDCPHCKTLISDEATRCPNCTGHI